MKNNKNVLSVLMLAATFNVFAADKTVLDKADAFYQEGDCENAVSTYNSISAGGLSKEIKDRITFRTAYCQFNLAKYSEAELGFANYLSSNPNDDEAKLKLAQVYLYQDKYSEAISSAQKVKASDFKVDADIVIARSHMEMGEYDQAINMLKAYDKNAEAIYWLGTAEYRNDNDEVAEKVFKTAIAKSEKDSWVKTESEAWLKKIEQDKQKFHFRITVGVLKDSNLDQSGGSGTVQNSSGSKDPGSTKAKFTDANYTKDTGKYAAVDLIHNTYTSRKLNLTTTASVSSPFYNDHASYNQQTASLDFYLKATPSYTLNYAFDLKYADTFYNKVYSQDYVYATPSVSWSFATDYWLKFSVPMTGYLNNKHINIYGGSLDLYYDPTNWMSISVGASTSKSTAPTAVIKDYGSGPTLISGTMFSHYTTNGAYLGLSFYLGDSYTLGFTGSMYNTKYVMETMPGTTHHTAREDKLKYYSTTFTKSFIQNVLSASLTYSHTKNDSTGFPGLISSGSVSNNSYSRNYALLSLEYYY